MRRLGLVVAVLAAIAAIATVVTRLASSNDRSSPTTTVAAPTPTGAGAQTSLPPTGLPAAVDVAGAQQAAMVAVGLTDEVVTAGFISRRDVIAGFTTNAFGPRLADQTSEQINALLVELGARDVDVADLVAVEQPLGSTATATAEGVRVEVWSVLVIAVPGTGPGRQAWRTVTVDMVDVDGRWLVDSWTSTPGPTPALPTEVSLDAAEVIADRIDSYVLVGG